ncbi:MAG: DUF3551 domain-containing protein [Rhizobiales bacterium]|nr:DUF3551 domain-containing protein [Hyphomicrobiales bacterium]
MMRTLMQAALAAAVLVLVGSAAQAETYPYCSEGRGGNYGSGAANCSFTSFAQCEATARGNGEWCHVNPAYVESRYEDEAPQPTHRRRARRSDR